MPQGKCAFCGTFVTSGGIAMGKHSVACAACAPLANKWLEKNGVDPKKYEEAQKSFSVVTKAKRAAKMVEDYRISATPTMVVNGRFLLEQGTTGAQVLFANVDQQIAQARATLQTAAVPAPAAVSATKGDAKKAVATPAK